MWVGELLFSGRTLDFPLSSVTIIVIIHSV